MITDRVLKRGAVLRELASLGCSATKAVEITGIPYATLYDTLHKCGVKMPLGSKRPLRINHIRDRVLRDYGKFPVAVMAERYGSTPDSVYSAIRKLRIAGKIQ